MGNQRGCMARRKGWENKIMFGKSRERKYEKLDGNRLIGKND